MEIDKSTRKYFNKPDLGVFDLVNIGDMKKNLKVYGTYTEPQYANYSADIDTKKEVDIKNFPQFIKEFRVLIKKIKNSKTLGLLGIQIGANRFETKKEMDKLMKKSDVEILKMLLEQDKIKKKENFFQRKIIKLDFFVWRGAYIKDMSIVYTFEPIPEPTRKEILADVSKFKRKGNFFKALKRLKLLYPSLKLDKFLLDNKLGTLYIIINKLDTLTNDTIPKNFKDISLQNIKNDVRKQGYLSEKIIPLFDKSTVKNIEKIRDYLLNELNKGAKQFFDL